MITCSQCGRENEVFFKFCLGCGAELVSSGEPKTTKVVPRDRTARKPSDTLVSKAVRVDAKPAVVVSENVIPAKSANVSTKPTSRRSTTPVSGQKTAEAGEHADLASTTTSPTPDVARTEAVERPQPGVTSGAGTGEVGKVDSGESTTKVAAVFDVETMVASAPEVFAVPVAAVAPTPVVEKTEQPAAPLVVSTPLITVKEQPETSPASVDGLTSAEPRICTACNAVVAAGHAFCANCGTRYEARDRRGASGRVEVRGESTQPTKATLVLIRPDQSDGESFPLYKGVNSLGRSGTDIAFPHDDFLARHHLDILVEDGSLSVIPKRTLNGTFFRITGDVTLISGNEIRVGQELLRVDLYRADADAVVGPQGEKTIGGPVPAGTWGRLCVLAGKDRVANAFLLAASEVHLGRDQGHVTFPHDGYVSGRHAKLVFSDGTARLSDVGSRNGTYVRITEEHSLKSGDLLLAGQQLFRIQFH